MNPYLIALYFYGALLAFYVLYIAAINIYRDWDSLTPWVQAFAFAPVVVMLIVDMAMQVTLFTLLFLDLPKEGLVTQRLTRYRKGPDGWRKTVAVAICEHMLNPFDVKGHC
jgi:hypothetical protein